MPNPNNRVKVKGMEEAQRLYRSSELFSHYFLEERLPALPDWQVPEEAKHLYHRPRSEPPHYFCKA
jgi:hypothetical protein